MMRELRLPLGMSLLDLTREQLRQLPPPREPSQEEWDVAARMVADNLNCDVSECHRNGCTYDFLYIKVGNTVYPAAKLMTWKAYERHRRIRRVPVAAPEGN